MRRTKQNDLIYNIINNNCKHYTAEDIYIECIKLQPNISLGTVYRNLNKLVFQKKIKRIKMPNNIDRYDNNIKHSHAICIKCGCIIDVFDDYVKKLPFIKEFRILDYDLVFNGICVECQKEEK